MKKRLSLTLALLLLLGLCPVLALEEKQTENAPLSAEVSVVSPGQNLYGGDEDLRAENNQAYGIVYDDQSYILYPKSGSARYSIDLWNEVIIEDAGVGEAGAAYFYNGGKWLPVVFLDSQGNPHFGITKYLKKGGAFKLCTEYDRKTRGPAPGAEIWEFAHISPRPTANRLALDYGTYADRSGETNGKWTLDGDTALLNLALLSGSTPDAAGWGAFPVKDGLPVPDLRPDGKQVNVGFQIRTKPVISGSTVVPASKPLRLVVKGVRKAPYCKVDYKNERIILQRDLIAAMGKATEDGSYVWEVALQDSQLTQNGVPVIQFTDAGGKYLPLVSKEAYASAGKLNPEESYFGKTLMLRRPVQQDKPKNPASAPQTIHIAPRPALSPRDFHQDYREINRKAEGQKTVLQERFKKESYEIWTGSGWGYLLPTGNTVFIRTKNTAKFRRDGSTEGTPASLPLLCYIQRYDGSSGSKFYATGDDKPRIAIGVLADTPVTPNVPQAKAGSGRGYVIAEKSVVYTVGTPLILEFTVGNLARALTDDPGHIDAIDTDIYGNPLLVRLEGQSYAPGLDSAVITRTDKTEEGDGLWRLTFALDLSGVPEGGLEGTYIDVELGLSYSSPGGEPIAGCTPPLYRLYISAVKPAAVTEGT